MTGLFEDIDGELGDLLVQRLGENLELPARAPMRIDLAAGGRGGHELLHIEGGGRIHHGAARGDGEHRKRIGLTPGEIARAFDRIDGNVGLEGGAGPAEALATGGLRRLALARLADHHHGIDIHLRQGAKHSIERSPAAVHAIAPPNPVKGSKRRTLADTAERIDELRARAARGLHDTS